MTADYLASCRTVGGHRPPLQFPCHALEELIDHHARRAADHPLADAGDGAAGADIAGVLKQRPGILGAELDLTFAFDETRRASPIDGHLILRGGLKIVQADSTGERPTNGTNSDLHLHLVCRLLLEKKHIATGNALGNTMRTGYKLPNRLG